MENASKLCYTLTYKTKADGQEERILGILLFYSYDFRPLLLCVYEFLSSFLPFLFYLVLATQLQKKKGMYLSPFSYALIFVFMFYIYGVYHFTSAGTLYEGLRYKFKLRNNLNFFLEKPTHAESLQNAPILLVHPAGCRPSAWQWKAAVPQCPPHPSLAGVVLFSSHWSQ